MNEDFRKRIVESIRFISENLNKSKKQTKEAIVFNDHMDFSKTLLNVLADSIDNKNYYLTLILSNKITRFTRMSLQENDEKISDIKQLIVRTQEVIETHDQAEENLLGVSEERIETVIEYMLLNNIIELFKIIKVIGDGNSEILTEMIMATDDLSFTGFLKEENDLEEYGEQIFNIIKTYKHKKNH